ncbi:aspartate aminotransferase family protein [Cohnella endophytica]|uniref:Aspartate aminotransferase family protein n=1 Tax=Cohnella endophytica TaxID=2419778 RepID=A0A494X717_9BACL|nr:aspartate aminotransferase family protein [Cohnella endophytica]RKP45421.1 aspartate aminotransferase family protein [Cohnella endophytica]
MKSFEVSERKLAESSRYLAGGVASSLRAAMKPTPLFVSSGAGSRVRDVDGNEYIDYLLAYGPLILGHAHPVLTAKVHEAMQQGYTYGLQHDGEIRLARRLTEMWPSADKVALSGSGTEAVMVALRLARAHTGKTKIVRFHGHFHGWSDAIFTSFPSPDMKLAETSGETDEVRPGTSGQSRSSLQEVILLPWNDPEALENVLRARHAEIAAVITEPVMCNNGCIAPKPGYFERMRELTAELGIVLIFDEVITGFRFGPGGAQERLGIVPDLTTMGKAMAGGIALSAVVGKLEIMNLIDRGTVNHLGTLNGNCIATAAALATIEELTLDDGAAFREMEQNAIRLADGLRILLRKHGLRGVVNRTGPVFHLMFIERDEVTTFEEFAERDAGMYAKFAELMLNEGVLVRPSGLWYLSSVHTEEDVTLTLASADRALSVLTAINRKD